MKDNLLTLTTKERAGYFFMFLTISKTNLMKLTKNIPPVNAIIMASNTVNGITSFQGETGKHQPSLQRSNP